jgi:hypothetical protein
MPGPRVTQGQVDQCGDHADQLGADWYQQASVTSGDARYTAEDRSAGGVRDRTGPERWRGPKSCCVFIFELLMPWVNLRKSLITYDQELRGLVAVSPQRPSRSWTCCTASCRTMP